MFPPRTEDRPKRWPRGQKFTLSAQGAVADEAYRAAGATSIAAVATHGLFPGNAIERIRDSRLFDALVCTDSHPRALALRSDFLQVESVAGVFARQLQEAP